WVLRSFPTRRSSDLLHRMVERQNTFQETARDFLGHHVVDPYSESQGAMGGALRERVQQVAAQSEDFLRVREDEPSGLRRHESPARLRQEIGRASCRERV